MPQSINQIVQDVCAVVGVEIPTTSVFALANTDRTMQEMIALANEMAQRIAYDTRDWTVLRLTGTIVGDGTTVVFNLPADFKRMLLTSELRSSVNPKQPLYFVPDFDKWIERRLSNADVSPYGEWTIAGGKIHVYPAPAAGVTIQYAYLDRNCVVTAINSYADTFFTDADQFRLDPRLLRLGMIWQWKAHKGSPYAEDMGSFSDALAMVMGHDGPAPILIGRAPTSHAQVAYPGNVTGPPWPFP